VSYQCIRPEYELSVDGLALGGTQFVIHAAVSYPTWSTEPERERVRHKAQMETLFAIFGEWERAMRIGVRSVRIRIKGDDQLDRFFRRWPQVLSPRSEAADPVSLEPSPRPSGETVGGMKLVTPS